MLTALFNLKPVCQREKPADNELTTKSQLLSSNRVIASAMLSIPVQACKREKIKKRELQDKCIVWDCAAVCL